MIVKKRGAVLTKVLNPQDIEDRLFSTVIHDYPSYEKGIEKVLESLGVTEITLIHDCVVVLIILDWLTPYREQDRVYRRLYSRAILMAELLFHRYSEKPL